MPERPIPTTEFVRRHFARGPIAYYEDGSPVRMATPEEVAYSEQLFDRWLETQKQVPDVTDDEVAAAVEGIKQRLSWASLHWGTEQLHPDALPHIARAALEAARKA